jgi:MIP family channel proteins
VKDNVRALFAEFLGVFILLFIGGMTIVSSGETVVVAFGFGLAILAGLYAFGEVSGGHFNPAVSFGALLDHRIDPLTFVQYVVAQVAGAVLAGLAILWAATQDAVAATATAPGPGVGAGTAFLVEIVLTAIFVAVILKVTKSAQYQGSVFVAIGLTLAAIHLAALHVSGASVNPARTLGSAIVGNSYADVWVYMVGPLLGAVLGWALYRMATDGKLGNPFESDAHPAPAAAPMEVAEEAVTEE